MSLILDTLFQVLFKLQLNGNADLLEMDSILDHLNFSKQQFVSMCIVAGCDYVPNIKTIGIHKAKQSVESGHGFLNALQKHKFAPLNYEAEFKQASAVFHHQTIYDIEKLAVAPLEAWTTNDDTDKFSPACGEYPF
jgi:exonuclease-1